MTHETVLQIFNRLFESGWVRDELFVVWHGGEPLSLPIDYYERAFEIIHALTPQDVRVIQAFQTNATLVTDEWCSFFNRHEVNLGVSVDGPAEIHDAARVTRSGRGTHEAVLRGIRRLRYNNVDFATITVLTALSLQHPAQMYEFFKREGIRSVCFNDEELEGSHVTSTLHSPDARDNYYSFMREFWNLNIIEKEIMYIREMNDMFQKIMKPSGHDSVHNTLIEPFAHINVDYLGNFSTFCPELLGQKSEHYGNFIIGNVWETGLAEASQSPAYLRLSSDVAAGVELCRQSCEYFSVCGGGAPANKFFENGTLASTETVHCQLSIKSMADLALEIIEQSASAPDTPYPAFKLKSHVGDKRHAPGQTQQAVRPSAECDWNIRVRLPEGDARESGRLEASAGLVRGTGRFCGWSYEEGAILPSPPWRPLSVDEHRVVVAHSPIDVSSAIIRVVRIPESLLAPFKALRDAAACAISEEGIATHLGSAVTLKGIRALYRNLKTARTDGHIPPGWTADGYIVPRPPGLPTATINGSTQQLVGLHADDWYGLTLDIPDRSPCRFCVNLGSEDRYLLFSPVPVERMKASLEAIANLPEDRATGTPLVREFLAMFPEIPILRLRVRPGEAYVAPTERIAHDVSTWDRSTVDVALHMQGFFEPSEGRIGSGLGVLA
jgi:uncharacterized protein